MRTRGCHLEEWRRDAGGEALAHAFAAQWRSAAPLPPLLLFAVVHAELQRATQQLIGDDAWIPRAALSCTAGVDSSMARGLVGTDGVLLA